jgi:hypothetical protein
MITATNNRALIMIGVLVFITLLIANNLITQSASALKSNGENTYGFWTYKLHNYDMTTKQNDCYHTHQYFGQQNFRNVPFGLPFSYDYCTHQYFGQQNFRNVPFGLPFPFRNVPFGLPFPYDYGTNPYFGQNKFRNDPFELPFP